MRIDSIKNYTYSNYINKTKNNNRINFTSVPDSFEKTSFDTDEKLSHFYDKLSKDMGIVSSKDIKNLVFNIHNETGESSKNIYKILNILTEYSSYKSLNKIEKELNKKEIGSISSFPLSANTSFNMPIPLTSAFSYIANSNMHFQNINTKRAIIIDKNILNYLQNTSHPKLFNNYEYIYIENFENGYNFLTQNNNLRAKTISLINKAKKLNNNKDIVENVQLLLNAENYKKMQSLGINAKIIKADTTPATPENIANNLNPIMPSKQEFISAFHKNVHKQSEELFFNNLEKLTTIVTPKQYNKYLQNLHKELLEYLEEQGKTMDDVYFVIPHINKSFTATAYNYQKINNIKNPKNIILDDRYFMTGNINMNNVGDNAVLFVLDDCAISGFSMIHQQFKYKETIKNNYHNPKNLSVVFAPAVAAKSGIDNLNEVINKYNRGNIDKVLQSGKRIKTLKDISTSDFEYGTSLILPYMGPDSNLGQLIPLYEKFLVKYYAQRIPTTTLDF